MMTTCCESAMLPAARMICSRSIRFTIGPINFPALRRNQNAAEWIALSQPLALFRLIQQHGTNLLPGPLKYFQPFPDGRDRLLLPPTLASCPGSCQTGAGRIGIDPGHNGFSHGQTALVYL